jgi:hypothetical protein
MPGVRLAGTRRETIRNLATARRDRPCPPYVNQLGRGSYEVCARCAFEFGFDDNPGGNLAGDSFESYRATWIAEGRPWLSSEDGETAGCPQDTDRFTTPPAIEAPAGGGEDIGT